MSLRRADQPRSPTRRAVRESKPEPMRGTHLQPDKVSQALSELVTRVGQAVRGRQGQADGTGRGLELAKRVLRKMGYVAKLKKGVEIIFI